MAPPGSSKAGASGVPQSFVGSATNEVIDVDAIDLADATPSTNGENKVKLEHRVDDVIDVVDPTTSAAPVPRSGGGPSGAARTPRFLKFGGILGVTLYEQKMEVLNEEAAAAGSATDGVVGEAATKVATDGGLGEAATNVATVGRVGEAGSKVATDGGVGVAGSKKVTDGGVGVAGPKVATDGGIGVAVSKVATDGCVGVADALGAAVCDGGVDVVDAPGAVACGEAPVVLGDLYTEPSTVERAPAAHVLSLGAAARAAREFEASRMASASRARDAINASIVADREEKMRMPWPPAVVGMGSSSAGRAGDARSSASRAPVLESLADLSGRDRVPPAQMQAPVPMTMDRPPPQRALCRTDRQVSLPRRLRRSFVRRAAVMQFAPVKVRAVQPAASAAAVQSASGSGEQVHRGDHVDVNLPARDAPESSTDEDAVDAVASDVQMGCSRSPVRDAASANPRKRSEPDEDREGQQSSRAPVPPSSRTTTPARRASSDALAEQLASRNHNPFIFPMAHWTPGAEAVLAASQSFRVAARLPLLAPTVSRGATAAGAGSSTAPQRVSASPQSPMLPLQTPSPPPRRARVGQVPPATAPPLQTPFSPVRGARVGSAPPLPSHSELNDGTSSSEMNDDDLVAAYITPPASPAARAPMPSPGRRPSSAKRRRSSSRRGAHGGRAAVTAAVPEVEEHGPGLALLDVQDAIRNGFSSVRQELTRLRGELVVVKSQAASALRRMDGLAASVDGSHTSNGVMLERFGRLEAALSDVQSLLLSTRTGTAGGTAPDVDSAGTINEIKVRLRTGLLLLVSLRDECFVALVGWCFSWCATRVRALASCLPSVWVTPFLTRTTYAVLCSCSSSLCRSFYSRRSPTRSAPRRRRRRCTLRPRSSMPGFWARPRRCSRFRRRRLHKSCKRK